MKPLAFLDVDGVLNRAVSNNYAKKKKYLVRHLSPSGFHRLKVILDPIGDKRRLSELSEVFELAWGSTWEDDANRLISPHLGLKSNMLVAYSKNPAGGSKASGVVEAAGDRPFIWFDDVVTESDKNLVEAAGGLLIHVESRTGIVASSSLETGLTDEHVKKALEWAKSNGIIN